MNGPSRCRLYSMKPSFRNLFMKKLIRDRVVPTFAANTSWLIGGMTVSAKIHSMVQF